MVWRFVLATYDVWPNHEKICAFVENTRPTVGQIIIILMIIFLSVITEHKEIFALV